jgi:hypothetical protein
MVIVAMVVVPVIVVTVVAGNEKVKLETMLELIGKFYLSWLLIVLIKGAVILRRYGYYNGKFCVIDVVHHSGLIMLFLFSSCEVKKDSKWYGEDEWL